VDTYLYMCFQVYITVQITVYGAVLVAIWACVHVFECVFLCVSVYVSQNSRACDAAWHMSFATENM
jgi:hypothetical protein